MYRYCVTVVPVSTDLVKFPSPGKVSTVRIELIHHGFGVYYYDGFYRLAAVHERDRAMTLFLLRWGSVFDLTVERLE